MRPAIAIAAVVLLAACSASNAPPSNIAGGGSAGTSASAPQPGTQCFDCSGNDRVFFGTDRYDLTPEARAELQKQAAWLKANPQAHFVIEGHCDEHGTREYNLALGERRAAAVKNYLVALGIDPARMKTISYGKERPAVLDHDENAWAQNRRAVIVLE